MKTAISVASVLVFAVSLNAQIAASINHLPGGADEIRIRNNSTIPLVAFVVTVKQVPITAGGSTAPLAVYSDPLIEPAARPLLPNEERVVMSRFFLDHSGRYQRLFEEPVVAAGILPDGATIGDPVLLARLILRRSNMLFAVETALETLSDAGKLKLPRDRLIAQFGKMADSLNRWYLSSEQQVGRNLYQSIAAQLRDLPEGQAGSPFPLIPFVEEEIAILNRQRVALLESQPSLVDAAVVGR